ncbi:MAG: DUF2065 domain-containing protein [Gammaproteobacteria bacterium]
MWQDLWIAFALMMIIEGVLPFLSPAAMRNAMKMVAEMGDRPLRVAGFVSMISGVFLLYAIR